MKVYCIIVTYNGMKWIDRCLGSLKKSLYPVQVVVVDNASVDGTANYIKQNFPEVLLIEAGANLGFGKANNIGLKKALADSADYIFLLNQDAFLDRNCLTLLIEASLSNKDYGILSPFHLNYAGNAIEKYFNHYIIGGQASDYISDLYFGTLKEIYPVSFVHAAGWLLPIDTIKKIGGFDPSFFHYGEDNDYIQRVFYKNYKVGFVSNAVMYHFGTNAGLTNSVNTFSLRRNFATIQLKNPRANFAGALAILYKGIFDAMTSAILSRNTKNIKEEWKIARTVLKTIRQINRSRKIQLKELAYLNE